jgi:hypothetical protein
MIQISQKYENCDAQVQSILSLFAVASRWIDQFFIVFGELIAGFCNEVTCTGHYSREGSKHAGRGS